MDSDKRSAQVERLEVVETGRRRRWSEDEKLKIVLESLQAPRQVAATARRYGISRSLLLRWRRLFQTEPKGCHRATNGLRTSEGGPGLGDSAGQRGAGCGGRGVISQPRQPYLSWSFTTLSLNVAFLSRLT